MNIRKTLIGIARVVAEEADRNTEFRARLKEVLEPAPKAKRLLGPTAKARGAIAEDARRGRNRRAPAVLDPVHLAKQGERTLRDALAALDLEKLRDVVAEYGMDTGKIVMKWSNPERVIDRIVEVARQRAQKGSAFREQGFSEGSGDDSAPPSSENQSPRRLF